MGVLFGLLLPFLGTCAGSACVFFQRKQIDARIQRMFSGFVAGIMVAASMWSLLVPAVKMSAGMEEFAFFPALAGFWLGILFLLFLDSFFLQLLPYKGKSWEKNNGNRKNTMLLLAVTIHNFPEGAACGAMLAGAVSEENVAAMAGAVTLALGIAIQNFPEGVIISLPMRSAGYSKIKAFTAGALSAVVEPIGAAAVLFLASAVTPVLPYLLAFAAGAMVYVAVKELLPEANAGGDSGLGVLTFAAGFAVMMVLDVVLA